MMTFNSTFFLEVMFPQLQRTQPSLIILFYLSKNFSKRVKSTLKHRGLITVCTNTSMVFMVYIRGLKAFHSSHVIFQLLAGEKKKITRIPSLLRLPSLFFTDTHMQTYMNSIGNPFNLTLLMRLQL